MSTRRDTPVPGGRHETLVARHDAGFDQLFLGMVMASDSFNSVELLTSTLDTDVQGKIVSQSGEIALE